MKSFLTVVCLSMALVLINGEDTSECLEKDSISCIQRSLYRRAKEFFDKDSIEILSGVTLVKSASGRNARSGKEVMYEQEMNAATNVAERQNTLENFVSDEAGDFLSGRSLRINFAPALEKIGQSARAMVDSVPQEVRQAVDEVVEGRGKKKNLKSLLPLFLAAKLKIGALATLAYFFIGFLAKKAIFASLISLAISGFIGLKSLWANKGADVTAYNAGGWSSGSSGAWNAVPANNGWSSSGSSGWDDPHQSSYTAQSQAFSGYHR